ncbi:MAG: hypothetical protein M1812_001738 [Candelaria pacifica]|nr:MAG: hypothetical protein M1812_001738 [Candelaria pacifica]
MTRCGLLEAIFNPLCATSTVGVAAVGYSFGRSKQIEKPRPVSNKRKAVVDYDFEVLNPALPVRNPFAESRAKLSEPSPPSIENPSPAGPALGRGTSSGNFRTASSPNLVALNPSSTAKVEGAPETIPLDPKGSIKSRSSWFRRLSSFSSSHNTNITSSPRSEPPPISWSNQPTVPIIQAGHGSSLPPNKLVKRASSQHLSTGNSFRSQRSSKSLVPTLRRPATSHQRSATLQQQSFRNGQPSLHDLFQPPDQTKLPGPPETWRMYFEGRPTQFRDESGYPRRRHPATLHRSLNSTIRRLNPAEHILPTLMMASSIDSSPSEDDGRSIPPGEFDNESFIFGNSRPVTSSALEAFTPSNDSDNSSPEVGGQRHMERPPGQPFSVSDMITSGSPAPWRMPRSRSLRGKQALNVSNGGKRISSAPMTNMMDQPTNYDIADAHRPTKRRDTSDPPFSIGARSTSSANDSPIAKSSHHANGSNIDKPLNSTESGFDSSALLPSPSSPSLAAVSRSAEAHSREPSALQSSPLDSRGLRPYSLSVGLSDRAETLVGSDSETRGFASGDEDDMDFRSETIFDSLRTGTTRSTSGARGQRIETIFDESPRNSLSKDQLATLEDLLPKGKFQDNDIEMDWKRSIVEEDESMSTPMKGTRQHEGGLPTRAKANGVFPKQNVPKASRSQFPMPADSTTNQWDPHDIRVEKGDWSFTEGQEENWDLSEDDVSSQYQLSSPQSAQRSFGSPFPNFMEESSPQLPKEQGDRLSKTNLFDWSEQPSTEKTSLDGSSPRPKTVHGKQGDDGRGSRSSGRKRPSALHVRSQSVPVVPESGTKREHSNSKVKFGTWGLGSKVVSEDWNEDFEFESFDDIGANDGNDHGSRAIKDQHMFVPQTIKERQASVLGHLGLVREFALHVEDIKRLRALASSKDILNGPGADKWKEADGIINLATLDDEEQEILPPHSPSSPDFDFDLFDEDPDLGLPDTRNRHTSTFLHNDGTEPVNAGESYSQELSKHDDSLISKLSPSRPRKDSTAFARNVIETMHQQRSPSDPLLSTTASQPQKKMPFDTTTLKDLVIHVGGLKKTLAELLRNSENIPLSPNQGLDKYDDFDDFDDFDELDPRSSRFFTDPLVQTPTVNKAQSPRSKSSNGVLGGSMNGQDNDANGHMTLMTVV